jgi:hypothetical protein
MSSHGVVERVKRKLFLLENFFFYKITQQKEEQAFCVKSLCELKKIEKDP